MKKTSSGEGKKPFREPSNAKPNARQPQSSPFQLSYRNYLRLIFVLIVFGGSYLALRFQNKFGEVPRYTFENVKKYDKDPLAFTQGLVFDENGEFLYESTGLLGQSSFRKIDWKTGKVLVNQPLDPSYFGEGLTFLDDKFYQLTWRNELILVYDRDMNLLSQHDFAKEMWGLTTDGKNLIISVGTGQLIFVDPKTMEKVNSVTVKHGNSTANYLNELEYSNGVIYANRYQSDLIYEIDAKTFVVSAVIDLSGLWPQKDRPTDGVLNGIAVNKALKKMFVTGKLCPYLYEIELKLTK
jgi:glutaminyl-peptide cyclotransferase